MMGQDRAEAGGLGPGIEFKDLTDEALEHLRALIRMDTTNPPGNETAACEYLKNALQAEGIEAEILEKAPGRGNLIARLRGDGTRAPLLLQGHLDVVLAESERWSHPPFGAEVHGGYLYGRGAVDMKNMIAMELMTLLAAKRRSWPLKRDIIFAAVADEESGCILGSRFLVEEHPQKVKAEYALGEIGGFSLTLRGERLWPIGVAEKGVAWLKIIATGPPGHGALPNPESAVIQIARAAERLGTRPLPVHVTKVAQGFLEGMAGTQPKATAMLLRLAGRYAVFGSLLTRILPDKQVARSLNAMLRNTANPTVLRAGEKHNVVPGVAELLVDGRTLPGQSMEDLVEEIHEVIGENFEVEPIYTVPPVTCNPADPAFRVLKASVQRHDPTGIPIPYLVPAFTDAKYFSRLGIKCFGFSPVMFTGEENFTELFHGHDERIPVEGFKTGFAILLDAVHDLAC